jgi:O-acetylserine/cysteine efflux transporter
VQGRATAFRSARAARPRVGAEAAGSLAIASPAAHAARVRLTPGDLALTLAVVALLGFSFVPIKVGLREVPPFALAALRFFFAGLPLAFFVRRPRMPVSNVVAYGLAIGFFQFGLLCLGMKLGMAAGLSSIVIQVQVFFTIGLGVAFIGDRVQAENIAGALIAALGIAVLAIYKIREGMTSTFVGLVVIVVAALAWGIGNIVAKRAAARYDGDMFGLVVWSSLVPPLPLAALSFATEGGMSMVHAVASASALTWGCAVFLAYAATLFGFASWARLLSRYPTALVSPFALLIPVSGLASGALFLGESLAPMQAVGAAMVLAGLIVNVYGARIRRRAR